MLFDVLYERSFVVEFALAKLALMHGVAKVQFRVSVELGLLVEQFVAILTGEIFADFVNSAAVLPQNFPRLEL